MLILSGTVSFSQAPLSGNMVIPVVVHIISTDPEAITDQQIIDSIADLNNAFAHSGRYTALGPGANTGISFCLAKIDPDGGNSTGITRTKSALADFDSDIENDRLKNLTSWNSREYCNIWYVKGVRNEYMTSFSCGNWSRRHDIGYSTYNTGPDSLDGIVTTDFGPILAGLMGGWLGLKYTFTGGCANTNCDTDGDGICDTPPASGPASSCTAVQNSCHTDTAGGFATDMPDLNSNFMSLGGACTSSFTRGQAAKMRSNLSSFRGSLLSSNKCSPSCAEHISAGFTRDNWLPKTGDVIHFTSTSTGGTNYQWNIDEQAAGTNSPTFSTAFPSPGKYKITLKVYNADAGCYASYSDFIIVGCGVLARFTPDVRQTASKDPILLNSILFSNRSVNAASYQWWMSNNAGMAPEIVSTTPDFNKPFKDPGNYSVWLVAKNGACSDTTEKFNFPVYDPTVDGAVSLSDVQCYQQTKIMVKMSVCNYGYASLPAGIPVAFYDADPASGKAKKLSPGFVIPDAIAGRCCHSYTAIIDVDTAGLNQLYAVFNDNGSVGPLNQPATKLPQLNYTNDTASKTNFQFHVSAIPPSAILQPGDTLQLGEQASAGTISSYLWSPAAGLSCTDCADPYFVAEKKAYDVSKKLVAISSYGCVDSSLAILHIPPADDFQISMNKLDCAGSDSLHALFTICNNFKRGNIPATLKVAFYDADPATGEAHLLGPVFSTEAENPDTCASYEWVFGKTTTGKVFAKVNDNGQNVAAFPVDLHPETRLDNNQDTISVVPFSVTINPTDTTISRLTSMQLNPQITGGEASTYAWEPAQYLSCSDCASPVATPDKSIEYHLTVHNEYACAATGTINLKTFAGGSVSIPNGFTPNNDGHNDVFFILGGSDVKMIKDFSVFNRWGQKVFHVSNASANDPEFGWNGLLAGRPAETGTYVYSVLISFTDGRTENFSGTITLIR
jgi:gliding motility-associated-like protein